MKRERRERKGSYEKVEGKLHCGIEREGKLG